MQHVFTNGMFTRSIPMMRWILCTVIFLPVSVHAQTDRYVGPTSVGKGSVFTYSYTYSVNNQEAPFVSPHWSINLGTIVSKSVSADRMTVSVTVQWGTTTGTGTVTVIDGLDTTPGDYNVTITTCPTIGIPTNLGPITACGGSSVSLTGTPGTNGTGLIWFTASSGGAPFVNNTSPTLSATTTYYAATVGTNGCPSSRTSLTVTMIPQPTAALPISLKPAFGIGSAVLSATHISLNSFHWYTSLTGGTATSGVTYTTPSISSSTNFYVSTFDPSTGCESSRTSVAANVMPVTNANSIQTEVIRMNGIIQDNQIYTLTDTQKNTTITYTDGLSRAVQSVALRASQGGNDIVQPVEYDAFGRTRKDFLPYVPSATTGAFHGSYSTEQLNFYNNATDKVADDPNPYAIANYEDSPLGRILEQGGVGADWQPGATVSMPGVHTKRINYSYNTGASLNNDDVEEVRNFTPDGTSNSANNGFYPANYLLRTAVTDENGNKDITFTDALGNTIVRKQQLDSVINGVKVHWLQTYYVYDSMNHLKYIIPPAGQAALKSNSWTISQTILDQHLHQFKYDKRGRLVQKKTPGQAWTYYAYDNLGRLVLTQDGNLRPLNQWAFVKYDNKGRTVMSGLYTDASLTTQALAQNLLNAQYLNSSSTWYEQRAIVDATNLHGYTTNQSFPSTNIQILTVAYYDDYDFNNTGTPLYAYDNTHLAGLPAASDPYIIQGLATGSKKLILNSANWLTSAVFYDNYGRAIQTQSNNHLNLTGIDKSSVIYDFEGKKIQTKTTHSPDGVTQTVILQTPNYDTKGRLTKVYHSINGAANQLLAQYTYNELGQVVTKQLHNTSGSNFLQNVDYLYNIKGWLASINDAKLTDPTDYFGMELVYNKSEAGLSNTLYYNGNVSAVKWKGAGGATNTTNGQRSYKFNYDKTDKLTAATFQKYGTSAWDQETNTLNETMSYDHNGNILTLLRSQNQRGLTGTTVTSTAQTIDNLTYSYASQNQLSNVADAANSVGFSDVANASGTTEYTYDNHGNLTVDVNKGITGIIYNSLGKAQQISISKGGVSQVINYTYDAGGNKLTMAATASGTTTTTNYVNGFVYNTVGSTSTLSFFSSPEGRVVKNTSGNYEYQYSIADHQGNTRIVFTSATQTAQSVTATFETANQPAESTQFGNYGHISAGHASTTPGNSQYLNGSSAGMVGVAKSYKVYPGDQLKIEAYGSYSTGSGGNNLNSFATALLAAFNLSSPAVGEAGTPSAGINTFGGIEESGWGDGSSDNTDPKAFVNIVLFDKDYKFLDVAYAQLKGTSLYYMSASYTVKEAGYAYLYVSNEQSVQTDVYFDDVKMTYTPTNIVQSNEYYPFGLQTANSWTRDNTANNFLYNQGSELNSASGFYDLPYRNYDATLGRFFQVDPLAHVGHNMTPYHYSRNNPIGFNDPSGALEAPPWGNNFAGYMNSMFASANMFEGKNVDVWSIDAGGGDMGGTNIYGLPDSFRGFRGVQEPPTRYDNLSFGLALLAAAPKNFNMKFSGSDYAMMSSMYSKLRFGDELTLYCGGPNVSYSLTFATASLDDGGYSISGVLSGTKYLTQGVTSVSQAGKDFIKAWETLRLTPYETSPGNGDWTIGWGHKILPNEDYCSGPLTRAQADALFETDLASKATNLINQYVTVDLSQQQFDALASYVFNVGVGNSLIGTNLISQLNAGNYAEAGAEMDITTSGGVVMPGLVLRRAAEQDMWTNGVYNSNH